MPKGEKMGALGIVSARAPAYQKMLAEAFHLNETNSLSRKSCFELDCPSGEM